MVCHPHVLPQSSTSSSSIRPINLQPTANEASHCIYRPTIPTTEALISFLRPPICHKSPTSNLYNPETAPHLSWVSSSSWPQITHHAHHTHKPTNIEQRSSSFLRPPIFFLRTEIELLPQTTHMQPLQPRNGAQFALGLIQPISHQLRRCLKEIGRAHV